VTIQWELLARSTPIPKEPKKVQRTYTRGNKVLPSNCKLGRNQVRCTATAQLGLANAGGDWATAGLQYPKQTQDDKDKRDDEQGVNRVAGSRKFGIYSGAEKAQ